MTLDEFLKINNGIIESSKAKNVGITNKELQRLNNVGKLQRVAHGLYMTPESFPDEYFIAQYRCPKGVFSHETALYFHDLSDRTPLKLALTIPNDTSTKLIMEKDNYQIYFCKQEIHDVGVTKIKSPFGNEIRVYDKERTICDCLKKRDSLDKDLVLSAVKEYLSQSVNDYTKLLKYAEMLGIRALVKQYMEVLI